MNPHPRGLGTPVFGPGAAVRPTRIHSFTAPGINGAQMGPDAALLRRIPFSSNSRARLATDWRSRRHGANLIKPTRIVATAMRSPDSFPVR